MPTCPLQLSVFPSRTKCSNGCGEPASSMFPGRPTPSELQDCTEAENSSANHVGTAAGCPVERCSTVPTSALRFRRRLQHLRQLTNILACGVTDCDVAQPSFIPVLVIERNVFPHAGTGAQRWRRLLLENKNRNVMFAKLKDQLRSRSLLEVGNASTHQRELRILQLRKIECEGDLALKPRLHVMAIG